MWQRFVALVGGAGLGPILGEEDVVVGDVVDEVLVVLVEVAVDGGDEAGIDVVGLLPDVRGLAVTGVVVELEEADLWLVPQPAAATANTTTKQVTAALRRISAH